MAFHVDRPPEPHLWRLPAVAMVQRLKVKEVTPIEALNALEKRMKEVDPAINAVTVKCFPRARKAAQALMEKGFPVDPGPGYLYGLPIVVKDLHAVEGVLFTEGSALFANRIAEENDPLVDVLEAAGGIVVGKTNTPEFGAGGNTFNDVFGSTLNPWNVSLCAGGSSGGSAAALAAGEAWLATGSDLGGSLRLPASFCGVVGMRPCVGRVPCCQDPAARNTSPEEARLVSVNGPMGRCVEDVALLLDAMAKPHPKDPWSREPPRQSFLEALQKEPLQLPSSIAWSPDLGVCPVQPGVAEICKRAADWFRESLGCQVVEDCPDFSQAQRAFQVLRAAMFRSLGFMLKGPSKDVIKPDLVWQIQKGVDLSDEEVSEAELQHSSIMESVTSFFQEYDLLACPCALLPPFDVRTRWVRQVEGAAFDNYIDWLMPTYIISLTKLPALSLPCGMTKEGTPVGIQLVGPPDGEAGVLAAALAYERAHPFAGMLPIDPI